MPARRYKLLDEFFAEQEAQDRQQDTAELPEEQQARLHNAGAEHEITTRYGVQYQRCGGGRRVIRRNHGGY